MYPLSRHDLEQHIVILGWLYIVSHLFFLLIGGFIFVLLTGIGAVSGDTQATAILGIVGTSVGLLMGALALPGLIAGWGLLSRKAWARVLALVVGFLNLVNFPLGTAIGLYIAWVLLQSDAADYFRPAAVV